MIWDFLSFARRIYHIYLASMYVRSGVSSSVNSLVAGPQSHKVAALTESLGSGPASPLSMIRRGYGSSSIGVSKYGWPYGGDLGQLMTYRARNGENCGKT